MANVPPILKPDAKAAAWAVIGFLVVPKVLNAVKR
jgi:hypothetical protein